MVASAGPPHLEPGNPGDHGIDEVALGRLHRRIERHVEAGWYPGAAVALARRGRLLDARSFGAATLGPDGDPRGPADDATLWLLYSQTKPIVSALVWILVERGVLRFHDTVAEYVPEFARHGKSGVTLLQVLTHQGGFPNADVTPQGWDDHRLLREQVCDFTLEWEPGSRVCYHGLSAHWVQAMLIEAVTERDYRDVVRELLLDPLGLADVRVGVPDALHDRLAGAYTRTESGRHEPLAERSTPAFWRAGVPGAGGYASAIGVAAFYQMLLGLGALAGVRVLAPRSVQYATRNHTGDRVDERFRMPMHRGLGVHVRGRTPSIRGLGSTAGPDVFGHGGVGTSYSWADPETGVSFTYLTNSLLPEPLHTQRLDEVMTLAHAAVVDL